MLEVLTRFGISRFTAAGQLQSLVIQSCLSHAKFLPRELIRHINMAAEEVSVRINNRLYRTVREGQASILAPYQKELPDSKKITSQVGNPRNNNEGDQAVFYNPIQQYNRDLTVLSILIYGESAIALKKLRNRTDTPRHRKKAKKALDKKKLADASREHPGQPLQQVEGSRKRSANDAGLVDGEDSDFGGVKKACVGAEKADYEDESLEVQEVRAAVDLTPIPAPSNGQPHVEAESALSETPNIQERPPRQPPFTILDALSASGLRAIRYAKEIPFATAIVANDLLPEAVDAIKINIEHNGLTEKVLPHVGDARHLMYSTTGNEHLSRIPGNIHRFDVIDLDPYGTAAPFLDAALQSLVDGGLLCVTCTDAGVWASNGYPEKAFALYNGIPLKGSHSHEAGLRLILHAISACAAKYGIAIEPLLSLSIDFYGRLFVRIHKSQQDVKLLAGTTMLVYNCDQGCGAWETQLVARNQEKKAKNDDVYYKHGFSQAPSVDKYCEHCGTKSHLGGPMWAGPLHNPVFVRKILDRLPQLDKTVYGTTDRLKGMLTVALEEEALEWDSSVASIQSNRLKGKNALQNIDISTPVNTACQDSAATGSSDECDLQSQIVPRLPPGMLSPTPFFFLPTYLAKVLSAPTPAEDPFRGALLGLGYTCTRSHCKPGSLKTNAPWNVIWEVMREWVRQKGPDLTDRLLGEGEFDGRGSVKKSSPGWNILRRFRGRSERLQIARLRESLYEQLGHGSASAKIDNREDLKALLQSALYELEHPPQNASNVLSQPQNVSIANGGRNLNGHHDETDASTKGAEAVEQIGNPTESDTETQPPKITGKGLIEAGGDPSELEVVFDEKLGKASRDMTSRLVRYQINPRANWGPMVRAGTGSIR